MRGSTLLCAFAMLISFCVWSPRPARAAASQESCNPVRQVSEAAPVGSLPQLPAGESEESHRAGGEEPENETETDDGHRCRDDLRLREGSGTGFVPLAFHERTRADEEIRLRVYRPPER